MRIKTVAVSLCVGVGLASASFASASPTTFEAGFGVRSIVPPSEMNANVWHTSRRRPTGVLPGDGIWARATFVNGDRKLGIISVDLLGLFYDDVVEIRDAARAQLGNDLEVIVASTHTHSSIDTLGIYGPDTVTNGIYPPYQEFVKDQAVDALVEAATSAQPVTMRAGAMPAPSGLNEYDRNRHPGSMDDNVHAIQFLAGADVVGTIVNWASHPEIVDPKSSSDPGIPAGIRGAAISSDFVHTLRRTVEAQTDAPALFLNGAVGAVTALAVPIVDPDTGNVFPKKSVKKSYYIGARIGETALAALADGVDVVDPELAINSSVFDLQVDNAFILALKAAGVVDRQTYLGGLALPFGRDVRTEMTRVQLGPVEMLTIPGEMQPDLYTGGYLPEEEKANPDVPEERPIEPQMTGDIHFIIGLGMDELGYFVSATDYSDPSLWPVYGQGEDRNGVEHYQETLSLSRDTARTLSQRASELFGNVPEPDYFAYPGGFLKASGQPMYGTASQNVRGIWVDTSNSGRFERGEDTVLFTPRPAAGAPSAYGFLDSQSRDMGTELANGARGVWVDGDADGLFNANEDPHLFFDTYAFGEGAFGP